MKIIDAQIHIWSQTVVPPSGLHRKVSKFTAEEALHPIAGIRPPTSSRSKRPRNIPTDLP
jgi:hypothetical protein